MIVASGFYEWKKQGKAKIPYYIRSKDNSVIFFAGIYQESQSHEKNCAIVTTNAYDSIRHIHNRMPLILNREYARQWLDNISLNRVKQMLRQILDIPLEYHRVSFNVNNPENNFEQLTLPVEDVENYRLF